MLCLICVADAGKDNTSTTNSIVTIQATMSLFPLARWLALSHCYSFVQLFGCSLVLVFVRSFLCSFDRLFPPPWQPWILSYRQQCDITLLTIVVLSLHWKMLFARQCCLLCVFASGSHANIATNRQ